MNIKSIQIETITISEEMKYKGELLLSYKIQYPYFQSIKFSKAAYKMNRFYKSRAKTLERYYREKLFPMAVKEYLNSIKNGFPVRAFEAIYLYQLTYNQDCTVSMYFDQYEYTGGAHGNTVRTSDTWDLNDGKRMTLSQFFSPPIDEREYAIQVIERQIATEIYQGVNYYFENYRENVADSFRPENFYLTPVGIIIYFQQYDIAPYSSGIREFLIPFSYGFVLHPDCDY